MAIKTSVLHCFLIKAIQKIYVELFIFVFSYKTFANNEQICYQNPLEFKKFKYTEY